MNHDRRRVGERESGVATTRDGNFVRKVLKLVDEDSLFCQQHLATDDADVARTIRQTRSRDARSKHGRVDDDGRVVGREAFEPSLNDVVRRVRLGAA